MSSTRSSSSANTTSKSQLLSSICLTPTASSSSLSTSLMRGPLVRTKHLGSRYLGFTRCTPLSCSTVRYVIV
ncbi:hypothetical protein PF005_g21758 [Phytophthora fragariae]|uniref:Uncharacterized protein n=1 Tax=Phytophthora fragariae TaxID=53985 RepID=A0A6A3WLF8_9STRA|nr:hypothetical protein PF003_g14998 [Phytophthora fragariae]KAE8939321.1 hypothetical protein PF009_g10839 [Phytophthora fragariae]KAE9016022.1 hypothetical protein PF011_g7348 [Phytophthora fragariae]KAE9105409.1 hypothetical protein PF010_g13034 [Phytophthora fragariae]KAE9109204.1 hypothetical protein PF007_g12344 [Phytophthora fragariae]